MFSPGLKDAQNFCMETIDLKNIQSTAAAISNVFFYEWLKPMRRSREKIDDSLPENSD